MLCRVEMPCNAQSHSRFYRWQLLHMGGAAGRVMLLGLPFLVVLFAALMLGARLPVWVPVLLALAAGAYYIWLLWGKPLVQFRKMPGAALLREVTVFTAHGLNRTVRSEDGGPPENDSATYSALAMAVETRQDFYLFTTSTRAYTVDKACFTNGTPAELRAALQAQLGERFHTKS
ncbi:MAG: hypothetical protein GXY32_08465 [Ruminococcaceae bacterium]|nr:hypothetical protein [Oscillospiraceae bacterium]